MNYDEYVNTTGQYEDVQTIDIDSEEFQKWMHHPCTQTLFDMNKNYNSFMKGWGNEKFNEVCLGLQWGNDISKCRIYFIVKQRNNNKTE